MKPELRTTLRFIGVHSCVPPPGGETACYLINGTVLVDAGWNAALQMRRFGCDPLALTHVFITHCHHDHYMGLAPLIYYRAMAGRDRRLEPLVIAGPHIEIGRAVRGALDYLQADRYPDVASPVEVVPLRPGEPYETDRLRVRTVQVVHPTLSVCYRFEDKLSGASLAISGDTAYYEPLGTFAAGVDALIHEASAGPVSRDPLLAWGHAGARDAAAIACTARPRRLYLVHYDEAEREEIVIAARELFAEAYAAREGEVLELPFE